MVTGGVTFSTVTKFIMTFVKKSDLVLPDGSGNRNVGRPPSSSVRCPSEVTMVKESLPSWVHQDPDEGLVHVNVGGLRRSLCSSTLKKFPDTRLGKLLACDSEEDILQVSAEFIVCFYSYVPCCLYLTHLNLLHPVGV